jgi:hypothetical protein
MTAPHQASERARADLEALLPLRDAIARRAGTLRAQLRAAHPRHGERIDARALRYERLVRLLETRIRIAAELLARGSIAPAVPAQREGSEAD